MTRSRVLYLTHRVPFPPDKGDRIRNYHLLRHLARRGEVWLGCVADEPVEPETLAELNRLCARVAVVPASGSLRRWSRIGLRAAFGSSLSAAAFDEPGLRRVVAEWTAATRFDVGVVSASSLHRYLAPVVAQGAAAVVDLMDVDSQKWLDFAAASRWPRTWLYRLEGRRLRTIERGLPRWTRAVSVVSRAEADIYDAIAGPGAATVATNGVDLDYFTPREGMTDRACAFVGAMDYLPNVDATVWFAREAWPAIRAKFPDAEFRIIGRKPAPAVRGLAALPGVTVVGPVPDVRPHVAAAAVVVAPLRLARGLQNKVLEALAMGKPVVAAQAALTALRAEPGRHLLRAKEPAEWADAVGGLFADPDRRRDLGAAGRRFVEEHHHWDRCLEPLLDKVFVPAVAPCDSPLLQP